MSLYVKAWMKLVAGFILLIFLYVLTKNNDIEDIVPPTTGLKGLVFLGAPILLVAWGLIELVTGKPFSEVESHWDTLKTSRKFLYGSLIIAASVVVAFGIMPYLAF